MRVRPIGSKRGQVYLDTDTRKQLKSVYEQVFQQGWSIESYQAVQNGLVTWAGGSSGKALCTILGHSAEGNGNRLA